MNIVRTFILSSLLCLAMSASQSPAREQLLSSTETMQVIDKIKQYAIVLGEGDKEIHTFIDPYSVMSQRYLRLIFSQKKVMLKKYRIYLYLLSLPSQKSEEVIKTILSSADEIAALKAVMLKKRGVKVSDHADVYSAIREISDAAKRIGVYKRPYIIINGKVR